MKVPLEISFRNVTRTEDLDELVRDKVAKLEQVCSYMISCRVAVEKDQSHQRTGNPYRVRLDIRIPPGHEIVVTRESTKGELYDDIPALLRRAFESARRQAREVVQRQAGDVKQHPDKQAQATVIKLFREEGYGFIQDVDGQRIYFHRNSLVHDDFDRLQEGVGVTYTAEDGDEGLQASTVQVVEPRSDRVPSDKMDQLDLPGT